MSSLIEKKGEKGVANGQIWIQDCKKNNSNNKSKQNKNS